MRLIDADALDEEVMHLFIAITGTPKQSTVVNECKRSFREMIDEQPTIGGWIPCSERLPDLPEDNEPYKIYMVTLDNGDVCLGVYRNDDKEWYTRMSQSELVYSTKHDVLAWMPLPEPYRSEGE